MIFDLLRITITTKGKYAAIEADAIPNLVNLLEDPESEVRLNALKVRRNQGKNLACVESRRYRASSSRKVEREQKRGMNRLLSRPVGT